MTRALVRGLPAFGVESVEIDRSGLSFMIDTLVAMSAVAADDELVLLLGADAYALFDQWKEPERIRSLAEIAVLIRGGGAPPDAGARADVQLLQTRRVDISSTELRARVADGRTIRGFVPDAVADYIAEHRLYR